MSMASRKARSFGWLAVVAMAITLLLVLMLRVNALRSQVRHEENRIVAIRQEMMYLQTEFETRASQQQLKKWNDLDFGYAAPGAGQYLENERDLAHLGKPVGPDAPAPVRVAELDSVDGAAPFPAMVSPLTGKPVTAPGRAETRSDAAEPGAELADRLGHLDGEDDKAGRAAKPAAKAAAKPKTAETTDKVPATKKPTAAKPAADRKDR